MGIDQKHQCNDSLQHETNAINPLYSQHTTITQNKYSIMDKDINSNNMSTILVNNKTTGEAPENSIWCFLCQAS